MTVAACDAASTSVDAAAPLNARTSAVSLRIDVPTGKPPSLTVLAFRAAFSGVPASDVLGLIDPLAATAPAKDCQLRDLDRAAAALVARGDAIELEELAGVGILIGETAAAIHPSPRLYPDLAATIGGVVGEAGPFGLTAFPEQVRVQNSATPSGTGGIADLDTVTVSVPTAGWVRLLNGLVPRDGIVVESTSDMILNLAAPARLNGTIATDTETSIEVRPFGATVALSCAVPADVVPSTAGGAVAFAIPRQALLTLLATSGATPGASVAVALDLVRRSNQKLPKSDTGVWVEVRTSTFVELRP